MKTNRALTTVRKFFPQAEEVIDSKADLTVEVTEKDDKNSRIKNHVECAMAVACKRKMHADGVIISVCSAYIIKGKKAIRYRVTESTAREVISFDRNGGFSPGVYQLRKPNKYEQLGGGYSGKTHNKSGRKSPKFQHHTDRIRTSLKTK